jgi:ABC-type multidrug transport system fused ATPase/permease subunit
MAEETRTYPLVEALIKRSRLPWYWTTAVVAAVLLLLLILAAFLDGVINDLSTWRFWQDPLSGMVLIIYILVVHVFMWRLRERAIQVFRPLLPLDEDDFNRLAAEVATPKRRWEWTSVLIGVGFACGLGQPWDLPWGPGELWRSVYLVITGASMNGLLAWLIYDTLAGAVRINRLSRRDLKLDIFDTEMMTPIALWSLGISLFFVGGISLSLVFGTREELLRWQSITMYVILVSVTVLIFFVSMWSAHRAMAEAKNRKLAMTREHLVALSRELEDRRVQGQLTEMQSLASTVNSWAAYHKLVKEVPTWPFNANIVRRLIASTVVPIIVYLIKILSGLGLRF